MEKTDPGDPELAIPLSTDLDDDRAIPYFLWDDPIPVAEVRLRLATASPPERDRLLGKILREARDPDVWRFTSPSEVAARFSSLSRHLGRRRPFWEFLLKLWHQEKLLGHEPAWGSTGAPPGSGEGAGGSTGGPPGGGDGGGGCPPAVPLRRERSREVCR